MLKEGIIILRGVALPGVQHLNNLVLFKTLLFVPVLFNSAHFSRSQLDCFNINYNDNTDINNENKTF